MEMEQRERGLIVRAVLRVTCATRLTVKKGRDHARTTFPSSQAYLTKIEESSTLVIR
jgi:hypothetical protein